jgi:carbonic anhydrase
MAQEIKQLIAGNKEFREKYFNEHNNLFNELVQFGQKPKIMMVACSDSRVDPAMIFNCQPGELFVIRNVANLVPPCEDEHGNDNTYHGTSAALEFGVCFLEVEHIIVFGHTKCGGVQALLENAENVLDKKRHSFIATWMDLARSAYNNVLAYPGKLSLEEKNILCEQYALVNSLNNLYSFSWIRERIGNKKIILHAWYFDLATGKINAYNELDKSWHVLS